MTVIEALLVIIENPYLEKGYSALKNHYETEGFSENASDIKHLINIRFANAENTSANEEQSKDN